MRLKRRRPATVERGTSRRRIRVPARLRRLLRPFTIVTAFGWGVALVGVVALTAGMRFGWAELTTIGVIALLLLLAAVPFILGRTDYHVTVELAATRVVVGQRAVGRVVVRNGGSRGSASTMIDFPVGRAVARFRVPRLAPGAEHEEVFTIPTQRRAVLQLGPVTSSRSDPLGLMRRSLTWTDPENLYVHPRTVAVPSELTGLLRDLEGLPTRDLADDDVSFHALREYVPGDDLRHVHWRSTARTGVLMIRQFEETRRSHLAVVLTTGTGQYANPDEFELAVSLAASIGVAASREGKSLALLTSGEQLDAQTPVRLLDALSGVELTADGVDVAQAAQLVATHAPGASVVALIAGSLSMPAEFRRAHMRLPVTATAFALQASTEAPLKWQQFGTMPLVSVPELDALRHAIRAVVA